MVESTTAAQPPAQAGARVSERISHSVPLKYADPKALPSYPSSGLAPDSAAASAAATLGWHNHKPVQPWKPDNKLSSASAAAFLAKDYKMAPQWEPTPAAAGHKAALLAVGSASSAYERQSSTSGSKTQHDGWGNSAATQAFHSHPQRPKNDHSSTNISHVNSAATQAFSSTRSQQSMGSPSQNDKSLMAAKGAMSSGRPRASSTPIEPRGYETAAARSKRTANALNGASIAHRASILGKPKVEDAGAVPITTMTRNMFTSHPPVKPEVDEATDAERIHQSAVEMARKMYLRQQDMSEQAKVVNPDKPEKRQPTYLNLQDAAYKQAQERLSKLQDDHVKNRELQEYYGHAPAPSRRRFTIGSRLRRKASDESFDDQQESEKIRQQMSMFSTKLSEIDESKRQQDRNALMAAAQRNVRARLQDMDEKNSIGGGKASHTMSSDWETRAQKTARERHETRVESKGKVNIGGGMYMSTDDIHAIASRRMQPILDDINEKAEAERERQAAVKLDEEMKKSEVARQKEREREMKTLRKQAHEEEKQVAKAEKQQAKEDTRAKKEEEKATKTEQKRQINEERRKSKGDSATSGLAVPGGLLGNNGAHAHETPEARLEEGTKETAANPNEKHTISEEPNSSNDREGPTAGERRESIEESHKSKSKVKGWMRKYFAQHNSAEESSTKPEEPERIEKPAKLEKTEKTNKSEKRWSLLSGKSAGTSHPNESVDSVHPRESSMGDLAMAGRDGGEESTVGGALVNEDVSRSLYTVSPLSSAEDVGKTSKKEELAPPKPVREAEPRTSISSSRPARFKEEI